LGYIDDAIAACCGHGVADFYVITNQNDWGDNNESA
jgi:hypothetical protein